MIPMMMQPNYKPKGWLGLIMGTRLYFPFHGKELEDDTVFESRVTSLCREIGDRGKPGSQFEAGQVRTPQLWNGGPHSFS